MVKEAESHKAEDQKRKELIEARNHADSLLHSTENQMRDHGDKLEGDLKSRIESAMRDLKDVKDGDNLDLIKDKTNALSQVIMKLGEAVYKGTGGEADGGASARAEDPAAATGGSSGAKSGDDKVVDADFEEVDDSKKRA